MKRWFLARWIQPSDWSDALPKLPRAVPVPRNSSECFQNYRNSHRPRSVFLRRHSGLLQSTCVRRFQNHSFLKCNDKVRSCRHWHSSPCNLQRLLLVVPIPWGWEIGCECTLPVPRLHNVDDLYIPCEVPCRDCLFLCLENRSEDAATRMFHHPGTLQHNPLGKHWKPYSKLG